MYQPNYNAVMERANPMNLNSGDFGFHPDTARLYLFTPRHLPTQVLRSHRYNFTPDFVENISSSGGGGGVQLLPKRFITANGQPAIHPDGNGMLLDATVLNQSYSFVLIIDKTGGSFGSMQLLYGTRQILIGYVASSDEPYNRATGTINPNAVLNFTHATSLRISNMIDASGINRSVYLTGDLDYINELSAQQFQDDTYLATPQHMLNTEIGYNESTIDASNMLICNKRTSANGMGAGSSAVDSSLKSPVKHMSTLVDALEQSVEAVRNSKEVVSGVNVGARLDDESNAKMFLKSNAPGPNMLNPVPTSGIDPARPMTIGNLDIMFRGALIVHPYEIPASSQWDVYPQEQITTKNVMSSFAAMSIAAIANECGLAHIVFRYASWVKGNVMGGGESPSWHILGCSTLVEQPNTNSQLKMLKWFKSLFEAQLVPILRQVSGDFDLMAYVNVGGEILLDLNFLDLNSSYQNVGFYETNTRLGGMLNPMIANSAILSNNQASINYLADQLIAKDLGSGHGMEYSAVNAEQYMSRAPVNPYN